MNCTLLKGHTDLVLALTTSKANLNILATSSKVTYSKYNFKLSSKANSASFNDRITQYASG